jgi:serine/threonine protein kinase
VVHLDLKPDNVLIREDGKPVLVDFGIAHHGPAERPANHAQGTPHFRSPEQVHGGRLDGRADLYSLGVIAFLWVTSGNDGSGWRWRYAAPGAPARTWQWVRRRGQRRAAREALRCAERRIPDAMIELVMRLLSHSRRGRPRSAAEVAAILDAAAP